MPTPTVLDEEVAKVAARIRKAIKGKLNEQNTKASMIEPILRELGWDSVERVSVVSARANGRLPATNGWDSWRYRSDNGQDLCINEARALVLARLQRGQRAN